MYLLDTNIVIELFAQVPSTVELIDSFDQVCSCDVVLGELYYGAFNSKKQKENLLSIERFISIFPTITTDHAVSNQYGQLKTTLKSAGKPLPDNDIWIAAIALKHKYTIVTRDRHFLNFSGLNVIGVLGK
jgi:tRNA(fMet)-specific endonuclease VapC